MKKIFAFVTVILVMFASCESGDVIGGRYYGTFNNLANNQKEMGSLSFKYVYSGNPDNPHFMMNDVVPMTQAGGKRQYEGVAEGASLNDLLKTMPAIDSIQVCENENEYIRMMHVKAEFMGNSVKTNMEFTTTNERLVNVEFIGSFE